jgi:drug/metabolite transporter (DMT)-like permease
MPPQPAERPLAAIAAQFCCFTAVSANDIVLKMLVAEVPSWQLMASRSGIGLIFLMPFVVWHLSRGTARIATRRIGGHLLRACFSAISVFSYFEALRDLDLPVATAILFVTPFFVVALSGLFLREHVPPNRWIAVVVGFVGALIIIRPGPAGVSVAALLAVLSAATWAATMVAMRDLTRTEGNLAVVFYFNLLITLIAGTLALPNLKPIAWSTVAVIAWVSIVQLISQFFMMMAFRFASASVAAPVQYVQLIWSVIAGWFIFQVFPGPHVWVGAAVIVASGLYLILSERRAAPLPERG